MNQDNVKTTPLNRGIQRSGLVDTRTPTKVHAPSLIAKIHANTKSRTIQAPTWEREDYPLVYGGRRMVQAHAIQGPEWVRAFSRWSLRIEFHLMDEPGTVSFFLNLGNDRRGPRVPGRRSKYYRAWTLANEGPPHKGEQMDWNIFIDKCFWARVEDCKIDSEGNNKHEDEVYSRIVELEELISQ